MRPEHRPRPLAFGGSGSVAGGSDLGNVVGRDEQDGIQELAPRGPAGPQSGDE